MYDIRMAGPGTTEDSERGRRREELGTAPIILVARVFVAAMFVFVVVVVVVIRLLLVVFQAIGIWY